MRHLFFLCMDGHLFRNGSCPFDGWTMDRVQEMEKAFAKNPGSSLKDLLKAASADEVLRRRALIIESDSLPEGLDGLWLSKPLIRGMSSTSRCEWHSISG